jgi:spore germination protein GerM
MRRSIAVILLLLVVAGAGVYTATRNAQPTPPAAPPADPKDRQVVITRPVISNNEIELQPQKVDIPTTGDPIEHTLNALLATASEGTEKSAIPDGTRLLSVKVKDGLATVDLTAEFRLLNKKGDTGESLAQRTLRKALAQFPNVQAMTVLVEGKLFTGGHSGEWEDIPVREASASLEERP